MIQTRSRRPRPHLIDNAVHHPRHLRNMHRAAPHLFTDLNAITAGQCIECPCQGIGAAAPKHETKTQDEDLIERCSQQLFHLDQGFAHRIRGVRLVTLPIRPGQSARKHPRAGQVQVAHAVFRRQLRQPPGALDIGLAHGVDAVDLGHQPCVED